MSISRHRSIRDRNTERTEVAGSFSASTTNSTPLRRTRLVHQGWLMKRGGNFAVWRKRWFILRGDVIFYYRDQEELKHLGEIPLAGNEVRRVDNSDVKAAHKFLFEIVPGEGSEGFAKDRVNFLLSAFNQLEMEEWMSKINHVIASEEKCMFKQSISATVGREEMLPHGGVVPLVVLHTCCFLRQHGLKELGLFRQSGRQNRIKQLQELYDKGKFPDFGTPTDTDIHTVASLLKLYLRSIPDAIIPQEYNASFVAATKFYLEAGSSEGVDVLKGPLKGLPIANFNCLKYLCRFLHKVQENADSNRMDISNLATVFGPNFVRSAPQKDDAAITDVREMMRVAKDTGEMNTLTRILIREHQELFPVADDESPLFNMTDYGSLNVAGMMSDPRLSAFTDGEDSGSGLHSAAAMNPSLFLPNAAVNPNGSLATGNLVTFESSDDDDDDPAVASLSASGDGGRTLVDLTTTSGSSSNGPAPRIIPRPGQRRPVGTNIRSSISDMAAHNNGGQADGGAVNKNVGELISELVKQRDAASVAAAQLQREVTAKKAWERRYLDERKAREAAEERARTLESQLDELFTEHSGPGLKK